MKPSYFLLALLLPTQTTGQAQTYVNAIVGTYAMNDMKKFQDDLINQYQKIGIDAKRELGFGSSLQLDLGVDKIISEDRSYTVGGFFNYAVTKGQIGYSDYSGEISAVQDLKRYIVGVKGNHGLSHGFGIYVKAGFSYSTLDLNFLTTLNSPPSKTSQKNSFHSLGFILEPGLNWTYNIKQFFVRVQAGYEVNHQGKTALDTDNNAYLLFNNSNEKVILDWSGARFAFGIGYTIH